jgi:autotransporter-associated beta strand protein
VFAEEGSHPVAVVISDNDSSAVTTSTTDTLLVTEPAISGSVAVLSPVNEGDVSASVTAASFTHAGGVEPATDFTATVDWGIDGHHADSATVAQPGGTGNAYVVTGDRPVYAEEGTYAVSVTISDDGSPTTISGGSITVADAALTAATGVAVSGTEGTSTGTIAVATFRDLGGAEPNAADPGTIADNYSATINWGGAGTGSSTGSIVYNSMTDTFTVQGSFAYAEEGSYTVSAHIVHEGGITADTASTATVGDAALTGSSGATAAGVEGTANSSMLSGATFTDANPGDHSGDFTATITWGDTGPTSLGTVSYDSASQTYTVAGSHTYSEDGSYSISIVVVDDGGSTATITGTATVAEGVLSFTSGTPFSTVEGNDSGTQTVANFSDAGLEPATVYSAVIHWGDGQDSAGSVTQTSPGHFSVTGDHTYAEDNSYNVSVTITDDTVPTTSSTTDTATVTEGGLSFTGGTAFGAVEGNDSGTQTVANFGDAGLEPATAYSAVIHWGDRKDRAGVVTLTSSGHFSVMGSHSYAEENSYNVSVTISDDGVGTTSGTTDTATVTEGGLSFTNGNMFSAMEGFATGTQTVANFSDTGLEPATAYSAMIHWSTGQNTVGVVTQTSPGQFAVTGSTTYAEDGSYNISVTITDDGNHATTAFTDTATVHEGVVSFTNGTPFTSVETSDSGTQIVANFSDTGLEPATGYSATVHWGDGNDSTGTVTQTSPGHFAISGSITYAAHGSYNISVTIDDDNVNTTSGTTDTATVVDRLTVINTNDSGPGSLRQVILYANTLSGPTHTITFAIPAGPQTINLLSPLPATTVPAVMVLDSTQNVVVVSPSPSSRDNFGTLTKTGAGTLTISGANNFGGNVQVDSGLLTLNNSVAPTLTAGITATADGAGTLELAGTVSALSGGANGVNVSNTSMAASGLLVSGTNQVVGGIDGTGNVVVNAGSDLTANHIVQGALVIGGAPGNSATVTIAASDASGNPMAAAAASSDSQATASVATASSDGGTSAAGNAMSMAELLAAIRARRLARQAATITASASAFVSEASASVAAPTVVESSAVAAPSVAESTAVAAPAVIESTDVAASAEAPLATSLKSASVVTLFGFNLDGTVSGSHVSNLAAGTSVSIASGADQSSITDNLHGSIGASGKLDPGAVSAAFDAEDLEWLGSDPFSTAAQPAEAQDPASIDGSLLADDLVEAIGSQWRN